MCSPLRINIAFTRIAVVPVLLFVTLPFVVRSVQPVLGELDREMEQAAPALGASIWTTFRCASRRHNLLALAASYLPDTVVGWVRGDFDRGRAGTG